MTTKDLIIQELDRIPEHQLPEVLELIRQLQTSPVSRKDRFAAALHDSLKENAGLYKRLADA